MTFLLPLFCRTYPASPQRNDNKNANRQYADCRAPYKRSRAVNKLHHVRAGPQRDGAENIVRGQNTSCSAVDKDFPPWVVGVAKNQPSRMRKLSLKAYVVGFVSFTRYPRTCRGLWR